MIWDAKKIRIAQVILNHRTPDDWYEFGPSKADLPDASDAMISRVAKELKENGWTIPSDGNSKERVVTAGQVIESKFEVERPSPYVIKIGKLEVFLEPLGILHAHELYMDIVKNTGAKGSFTEFIEDSAGLLWRLLVPDVPVNHNNVVEAEVVHD